MAANPKPVPTDISEEYYQIGERILDSFPKYRPPLDLFFYVEKVMQLIPYSRKGARLSNEQVEEVQQHCRDGNLFVSRADRAVYSEHISKQLDLILVDRNLKEGEIVTISLRALEERLEEVVNQPVQQFFTALHEDVAVVTEYLWEDKFRLKLFLKRLWSGRHSMVHQGVNTFVVGLWLLIGAKGSDLKRPFFNDAALGLLIHDIGMSKIPAFIRDKSKPLTPDERSKIPPHPLMGAQILRKTELYNDTVVDAILSHHERLDGSGYPQKKTDISMLGRIAGVADAFSAMIQCRPYAPAMGLREAAQALFEDSKRFDTKLSSVILAASVSGELAANSGEEATTDPRKGPL
jgi:HD-GYP domain